VQGHAHMNTFVILLVL